MDAIAVRIGIDPIEVRRRNLILRAEMPYARPMEGAGESINFDTGDYIGLLDKALKAVGWNALQAELKHRRAAGELVGAGLAMFVEATGMGPRDGVEIVVEPTGAVEVITGGSSVGQGFETVIAQICADTLGVDYRKVRVVRGKTDRIEHGIGAHASRATVMTGNATYIAAGKVRDKALEVASELLQAPASFLTIVDGVISRSDHPSGPSMSLSDVAQALSPTSRTLGGRDPGLGAKGWFHSERQVYPYGVQIALVAVDQDTGGVTVERYLAALDIGRAINPMLVKGQVQGGVVQGLGGALYEEFVYSETGEPLSITFADYLLPTMREIPALEVLLCEDEPTDRNPLGIKGAGENGIGGVGAAIASALDDAIGMPGAITQLPVTPARLKTILSNR
jgi:carbon-monoxide dehydrogenase large subunit/6-hydroxypseudooxynicotine dehydrogenase subunit gamma